jgi:hypothetical protein
VALPVSRMSCPERRTVRRVCHQASGERVASAQTVGARETTNAYSRIRCGRAGRGVALEVLGDDASTDNRRPWMGELAWGSGLP